MSIFETVSLPCPSCGTEVEFEAVNSVNADRRPDLREAIMEGTFQQKPCGNCESKFRLQPKLIYQDVARSQWFLVYPADEMQRWQQCEDEAQSTFDRTFGADAPESAKAIGEGLHIRVVFGWAGLREKLAAADAQLEDRELELTKIATLGGLGSVPMSAESELRYSHADAENLVLAWVDSVSDSLIEAIGVPREIYDDVVASADWKPLREALSQGSFVDLRRMVFGLA